jgi:mannose-6-phosphate isomerase-like protein (cupin superfamily)
VAEEPEVAVAPETDDPVRDAVSEAPLAEPWDCPVEVVAEPRPEAPEAGAPEFAASLPHAATTVSTTESGVAKSRMNQMMAEPGSRGHAPQPAVGASGGVDHLRTDAQERTPRAHPAGRHTNRFDERCAGRLDEESRRMRRSSDWVVGCLALAMGCGSARGGASVPRNGAGTATPAGVAEAQAAGARAGTRPGATGLSNARAEAARQCARAPFRINVRQSAYDNEDYRRVIFTGARSQMALMTIQAGGDVGLETHPNVEQLIFVASGSGKAIFDGVASALKPGDVVVAPPGVQHNVVNTGAEPLRLYTVYSPPNHIDGRVHPTKEDAARDSADEEFGRSAR